MYEEGNKKISWLSLIIKILIAVLLLLLIVWLVFKFSGSMESKTDTADTISSSEFSHNLSDMKDAALDYFTDSNLPTKLGQGKKVTLEEMISKKLLADFTDDGETCSTEDSYAQATKTKDGVYSLKVSLTCGEKSDYIISSIETDDSSTSATETKTDTEDDTKATTTDIDTTSNNVTYDAKGDVINSNSSNKSNTNYNSSSSNNYSSSNSSSSNKTTTTTTTTTTTSKVTIKINCSATCCSTNCGTTTKKTRYYRFYKWSEWSYGYSSSTEAENKQTTITSYNYCLKRTQNYYGSCFISANSKAGTYTNEVSFNIPSNATNITLSNATYYNDSDYQSYMSSCQKYGNCSVSDLNTFKSASLKSGNYSYTMSNVYYSNGYKAKVTINYNNANGVSPYCISTNCSGYFAPYKVTVTYTTPSDCNRDYEYNGCKYCNEKYIKTDAKTETIWMHRTKEYTWSTQETLEGYTRTGEYLDR